MTTTMMKTTMSERMSGALWLAALGAAALAGCGPTFDPASLITTTRVLGARVDVGDETPSRAAPMPGESATVTWLVEAPSATPPLAWVFVLCAPGTADKLTCAQAPFATFQGTESPPRMTLTIPPLVELGGATRLLLYGRICANSAPTFDAEMGYPGCTGGGQGTTATATIAIGSPDASNRNPTADHGFTFDGADWPVAAPGADPCGPGVAGPRIIAGSKDHVIGITTIDADRETYGTLLGDPPVPTTARESLQISQFATAGEFKNGYSFVEASEPGAAPVVTAKWNAPAAKDVLGDAPIAFTFVAHDGRGGTDWTTRTACVTR